MKLHPQNPKPRRAAAFVALMILLTLAGGLGLATQRGETVALRAELDLAQMENAELAALRAENARLQAQQIPAPELERLRRDHAALQRLRAELAALQNPTPHPPR